MPVSQAIRRARRSGMGQGTAGWCVFVAMGKVQSMAEAILGEIRLLAGTVVPPGWAACDGQELAISDHKALYAVLGGTYGGNGKTTFALPDLRGRTPLHSSPGSMPAGEAGGETGHAITVSEVPAHSHGALGLIAPTPASTGVHQASAASIAAGTATTSVATTVPATSTGAAHDNLQPYLTGTFVIATHGVSPSRK